MLYTFIDIETTGFMKFDANAVLIPDLLEFSYLQVDSTTLRIVKSGSLYFYQPHFDIESDAQEVHGLTRDFLMQYEDQFEDNLIALASITCNATICGKNSKKFDIPFIKHFLKKYSGERYDILATTRSLCMKGYNNGTVIHDNESTSLDIQELYAPVYRVKMRMRDTGSIGMFYENTFSRMDFDSIESTTDRRKRGKLTDYIALMPNGASITEDIYKGLPKERETSAHGALYDCVMTYVIWLDYIVLQGRLK
jgi:hypothetical protein